LNRFFSILFFLASWYGNLIYGQHQGGIVISYGDQIKQTVNYNYHVMLFQLQYAKNIRKLKSWDINLLIQPQFNLTSFSPKSFPNNYDSGYEVGTNTGLLFRKKTSNEKLEGYFLFSVGPHFISKSPPRQSPGFIFSDNYASGLYYKLTEKSRLDLRLGFRHLSNLIFKKPNGGLNNYLLGIGFLATVSPQNSTP